ncbi:protein kinase [Streptomyces sp. NPDC051567]|uniref:serine/threonine-protein kinase n=1 Tax=Streptomyces sp. NPDC051567 TaxID=3365660 RepID=UPI0037994EA2
MSGEGQIIAGRYTLLNRIGAGGMGVVWLAWDPVLERQVALKCAHMPDGAEAERLRKEARNAARLHHPNIVRVLHFFTDGTGCWIVMDYVPSRSLRQILDERGTLRPEVAGALGCQIADALAVSHREGVVHGDVTPENILVTEDGTAKLTDFGISRTTGSDTTFSGGMRGKPPYVPPEVAQAKRAGHTSDVFSLGATLYRAVEGRSPYGEAESALAYLMLAAEGRIVPPTRSGPLTGPLTAMFQAGPENRPTAAQARELLARAVQPASGVRRSTDEDGAHGLPRFPQFPPVAADEPTLPLSPTAPTPGLSPSAPTPQPSPPVPPLLAPPEDPQAGTVPLPPWWWRHRGRISAGVLAAVAVALAVLLSPPRKAGEEPGAGSPAAGPVAALTDARRADPCSLLDPTALARFGHTRLDPDYGEFARCDVLVSKERGGEPFAGVKVDLSDDPVEAGSQVRTETVGRVTVSEVAGTPDRCGRNIRLADAHQVWITADQRGEHASDLCALARAATDRAVKVLNRGPVPERPAPFAQNSLARLDACSLLDAAALGPVTGVDAPDPDRGFADWSCAWEGASADIEVRLSFSRDNDLEDNGRLTTVGGRRMYVAPGDHGADTCVVRTEHRGYTNAYGEHTIELVMLAVRGKQPVSEVCDTARALSARAAGKLPTAGRP